MPSRASARRYAEARAALILHVAADAGPAGIELDGAPIPQHAPAKLGGLGLCTQELELPAARVRDALCLAQPAARAHKLNRPPAPAFQGAAGCRAALASPAVGRAAAWHRLGAPRGCVARRVHARLAARTRLAGTQQRHSASLVSSAAGAAAAAAPSARIDAAAARERRAVALRVVASDGLRPGGQPLGAEAVLVLEVEVLLVEGEIDPDRKLG